MRACLVRKSLFEHVRASFFFSTMPVTPFYIYNRDIQRCSFLQNSRTSNPKTRSKASWLRHEKSEFWTCYDVDEKADYERLLFGCLGDFNLTSRRQSTRRCIFYLAIIVSAMTVFSTSLKIATCPCFHWAQEQVDRPKICWHTPIHDETQTDSYSSLNTSWVRQTAICRHPNIVVKSSWFLPLKWRALVLTWCLRVHDDSSIFFTPFSACYCTTKHLQSGSLPRRTKLAICLISPAVFEMIPLELAQVLMMLMLILEVVPSRLFIHKHRVFVIHKIMVWFITWPTWIHCQMIQNSRQ